jgi:hypothetical protein
MIADTEPKFCVKAWIEKTMLAGDDTEMLAFNCFPHLPPNEPSFCNYYLLQTQLAKHRRLMPWTPQYVLQNNRV